MDAVEEFSRLWRWSARRSLAACMPDTPRNRIRLGRQRPSAAAMQHARMARSGAKTYVYEASRRARAQPRPIYAQASALAPVTASRYAAIANAPVFAWPVSGR